MLLFAAAAVTMLALLGPKWALGLRFGPQVVTVAAAPERPVAIVFGAGLRRDGRPTAVLSDRIETAVELYRMGKVGLILMSGSVRPGYDEPSAMAAQAIELGVPPAAIQTDPGGVRTLESCRRARQLFGVRSALLVSQAFHLPRALALCEAVGVEADGVAADRSNYSDRSRRLWELREYPASLVALVETLLTRRPAPEVS